LKVTDKLAHTIKTLPHQPGVYHHLDADGKVIYVGKAKDLKKRVSSYFSKTHESARLILLVKRIADIQVIETPTEFDALLLENTLIKKHQPRFNILLKDDKSYPWICIKNERFPRLFSTRRKVDDGSEYFGPYASIRVMKTALSLINQITTLRTCKLNLSEQSIQDKKHRLCLEYQIGNCKGPCEALQSEEDYLKDIHAARQLLKGHFSATKKHLHGQMIAHSTKQDFEAAQAIKEKLGHLAKYTARSTVVTANLGDLDVFTATSDATFGYVNCILVRQGAVVHSHSIEIKKPLDESNADLLRLTIPELRLTFQSDCKQILCSESVDLPLQDVTIQVPQRGQKMEVIKMSLRNAKALKLERIKNLQIVDPERHANRIMQQMKVDLRLSNEPRHIECFDNSNLQGEHPVSACVVFKDGKSSKREYRHFNVKTVVGADDYATMAEVITRRYTRLKEEGVGLPQLIVIDGGKGQLSASVKALEDLGLRGVIAIIGIAKRLEEIYFPGDSVPLYLDKRSETLKVIQQARNEAHRFSITHHRKQRSKAGIKSQLEVIPGIGPQAVKALLNTFKSLKGVKKASREDLVTCVGKARADKVIKGLLAMVT
jgi:excinuclease ABC subunit C|tara:strand:- start:5519 stop:7324 length:1806 start_codon:yes stop_codon:yes gene_type:complete